MGILFKYVFSSSRIIKNLRKFNSTFEINDFVNKKSSISLQKSVNIYESSYCFERKMSTVGKSNNVLSNNLTSSIPTAGIIIIGDEILKGQTKDVNTNFLAKGLYKLGVKVMKVSVVPDHLDTIASEVAHFSNQFTHVITSGGIGPTHDDITFEGVGKAFNDPLVVHPEIVKLLMVWFKTEDKASPAMKMARIPSCSKLHYGENKAKGIISVYPTIQVKNVTIYPGIPHLLQRSFDILCKKLYWSEGDGFQCSEVYLNCIETIIADNLNIIVKQHPQVTFGSYPDLFHSYYRTKITLESLSKDDTHQAKVALLNTVDKIYHVNFTDDTISNSWVFIDKLLNSDDRLQTLFVETLKVVEDTLEKYSLDQISICYNGGKDCLVVLHIFYAILQRNNHGHKIPAVYITEENSFPQVDDFVRESINRYNLDCDILPGPMKPALHTFLSARPSIKAVLMGTRRTDPHGEDMKFFSPTDRDWPKMVRVNPIINWSYSDVWKFIRGLYLPYCGLYDRGYTSLGSMDNTLPNSSLRIVDPFNRVVFEPAYKLEKATEERNGRS